MHIGNIFQDLEIDTTGFMDDPDAIKRFTKDVLEAEKFLVEILNSSGPSVSSIEEDAMREFKDNPAVKKAVQKLIINPCMAADKNDTNTYLMTFEQTVNSLFEAAENADLSVAYGMMIALKKLSSDIENAIHDRAKMESTSQHDSLQDKKLAQIQHKRLREAWETYCKFVKLFHGMELPKIKARPGNYAPSLTEHYQYQFPGEDDVMYNYRVVAQRLGIYYEGMKFMDIFEYCMDHPDEISVKKVSL